MPSAIGARDGLAVNVPMEVVPMAIVPTKNGDYADDLVI